MKRIAYLLILIAAVCAMNAACKKDKSTIDNKDNKTKDSVAVDSGRVTFHIHTYMGEEEVDGYNINYTLDNGRKISLSRAQFYISGIQLVKSDGSMYSVPNIMLLKVLETESYFVANVPAGTYKAVKFKVGLDSAMNAKDATGTALLDHPEMWFGSTSQPDGYVFLNAQGRIDTSSDASASAVDMRPFVYKIGTSAHYVPVTMPDRVTGYTITKGGSEFVHMLFDYSKLFDGVQINSPMNLTVGSKTDNASAISTVIANNISGCFRYEE